MMQEISCRGIPAPSIHRLLYVGCDTFRLLRAFRKGLCQVEVGCAKPYAFVSTGVSNAPESVAMTYESETPCDNIESARDYVEQLLAAAREAQGEIEEEILRATDPQLARRQQALQLVKYKLNQLASHVAASRRILNDLTKLRRLLLEARKTQ